MCDSDATPTRRRSRKGTEQRPCRLEQIVSISSESELTERICHRAIEHLKLAEQRLKLFFLFL